MLDANIPWVQGLFGGALLGVSALVLLAGYGKIAGISGIVGYGFARPKASGW